MRTRASFTDGRQGTGTADHRPEHDEPCLGTSWDLAILHELARAELQRLGPDASGTLREVLEGMLDGGVGASRLGEA